MKKIFISALVGAMALSASALELTGPSAGKMLQFENGDLKGYNIQEGVLSLTPAPNAGLRVGILPVYIPATAYKLTADITFPGNQTTGHAGFLVRRSDKKSCYFHVTPSGTYAGMTGAGPKLIERRFKSDPTKPLRVELFVGSDCVYAFVNGELSIVAEKLEGGIGTAAFFTFKANVQYHNVKIDAVSEEELGAVKLAKLDFTAPEKARKAIIFEHGAPNSWKIADGKLTITPPPKSGVRLGISPGAIPHGPYKLTARLTFADPTSSSGHAGFQVRRSNGKSCYVHVSPKGNYIGVTGIAPKLPEKIFKKGSPEGVDLEITVRKDSMDIRMNGQPCFNFNDLEGDIGGIAFNSWLAHVSFSDVKIVPVSESTFKPVPGAILSTDFFRPARIQRRMRLHYGNAKDFSVSQNLVELKANTNCVILGGTEGMRDFAISTMMQVDKGGTGGFLVRRDCGKQIYVFLGANNSCVGIDKKSVPLPAELAGKPVKMDIDCRGDNLIVKINDKTYLNEKNLNAKEGAVAMTNYNGHTKYYSISVTDHNFFNTVLPID